MANEQESTQIRQEYAWFYPLLAGGFLVTIGIILGVWLFGSEDPISSGNMLSYVTNLWTEALSIGITIFVIDQYYRWRDRKEKEIEESAKAEIERRILQIQTITRLWLAQTQQEKQIILDVMRKLSLFTDANLSGIPLEATNLMGMDLDRANFSSCNLKNCNLMGASLKQSRMSAVDLTNADLSLADLSGADLYNSTLDKTTLDKANLSSANLSLAKLSNVRLKHTSLENADLSNATIEVTNLAYTNLRGANLCNTNLQYVTWIDLGTTATLPDGTKWYKGIDIGRFTDPEHPDFWQPNWVK